MADRPMTPAARMRERAAKVADDLAVYARAMSVDAHLPAENLILDTIQEVATKIAAAIRALPDEDEWQPIETAPRDGSEIWAFNGEQARMKWAVFAEWSGWLYADDLMTDVDPDPPQPIHWRPLPAPPKGGK